MEMYMISMWNAIYHKVINKLNNNLLRKSFILLIFVFRLLSILKKNFTICSSKLQVFKAGKLEDLEILKVGKKILVNENKKFVKSCINLLAARLMFLLPILINFVCFKETKES